MVKSPIKGNKCRVVPTGQLPDHQIPGLKKPTKKTDMVVEVTEVIVVKC